MDHHYQQQKDEPSHRSVHPMLDSDDTVAVDLVLQDIAPASRHQARTSQVHQKSPANHLAGESLLWIVAASWTARLLCWNGAVWALGGRPSLAGGR